MLVHVFAVLEDVLTDLIDTAALLDGAKVGLFKAGNVLGGSSVLADVDECDFEGYARQTITSWLGPLPRSSGLPVVISDDVVFTADDPLVTPNEIGGWFLTDDTVLIAFGTLTTTVMVSQANQVVLVRAEFGPAHSLSGGEQVATV